MATGSLTESGSLFMADSGWLVRHRATVYPLVNLAVLLACLSGAVANDLPFGVAVYTFVLFALCSAPLLLLKRLNDRYAPLAAFLGLYFLFFGALSLQSLLFGTADLHRGTEFLTAAEFAILLGAAAALLGYLVGARWGDSGERQLPPAEWPSGTLFVVGVTVWLLGTAAMFYFQVIVAPSKLGLEAARGMASMGPVLTFVVMLGNMMQPVGILILAYGYAKYGSTLWFPLILAVVLLQVAVGFVADMKMQAMMGAAAVIMVRTVVTNRLPKAWIAVALLFLVVAFPIFQAYRVEVTGERGLDRAQALQQLDKVLDIVMASRDKVTQGRGRAETFLERASSKQNLEILFAHVGRDVPLLNGRSLIAIPMAFVPRLLAPDKEDLSVGQLFGKQILKADSGVYISISHLGELYWNFGWPGVVLGMFAIGLLLGFIGAKFNIETHVSLTRVLVVLGTIQPLCLGFGGTMPISYVLWLRGLAAIALLHLIFARRSVPVQAGAANGAPVSPDPVPPRNLQPNGLQVGTASTVPVPRFPNMLR